MLMVLNGGSMERKQESFQLYTTTAVVLLEVVVECGNESIRAITSLEYIASAQLSYYTQYWKVVLLLLF